MEIIKIILGSFAAIGVVVGVITYLYSRKTRKAQFIFDLNRLYHSNKKYLKIFNEIEWKNSINVYDEKYKFDMEGFLAFFDFIVQLRYLKIIKDRDFHIYRYMLSRVLTCNDIEKYFIFLEDFSNKQKINFPYSNLKKYKKDTALSSS